MNYKYYSTQRPVMLGGYPKPPNNDVLDIVNFDERIYCEEIKREAWGYLIYKYPLSYEDIRKYELKSVIE